MSEKIDNPETKPFIDGMYHCYKGWDCPKDAPKDFVRGYNAEYTLEQIRTHRSENEHHRAA